MRWILVAVGCALALAGCGSGASPGQPAPAQIQVTPAVQQTALPSATPSSSSTPRGYDDGY